MSNYVRVIPRDFFNESKLLKCHGQLTLNIHKLNDFKVSEEFDNEEEGFQIMQSDLDGSIFVSNYIFRVNGNELALSTPLNNKENYPMTFLYYSQKTDEEYMGNVFEENGVFSEEFYEILNDIKEGEI
jgi:hypothetical protein